MNNPTTPQASTWTGLVDRLWRLLAWPRLTPLLLVWLAAVLALSTVIPQSPPNIEDPTVRSQWLANLPPRLRPAAERLQPLGIFDVRHTVWLRLPLALLLAHALVMLAGWAPAMWYQIRTNQRGMNLERRRWGWLAQGGLYLGLGLASWGLILQNSLARAPTLDLQPGNPTPIPVAGAPNLELEEVMAGGNDPMNPTSGRVVVRILSGVGEMERLSLKLYSSRMWRGGWLTLVDLRPMVEASAVDVETGEDLLLQPFYPRTPAQDHVRLPLTGDPQTRFVGLPTENATLFVDYDYSEAIGDHQSLRPTFTLSLFHGAEAAPRWSATSVSGQEISHAGVRYLLKFDYDAMLRLNSALWWALTALGWILAALSLVAITIMPSNYAQLDRNVGG